MGAVDCSASRAAGCAGGPTSKETATVCRELARLRFKRGLESPRISRRPRNGGTHWRIRLQCYAAVFSRMRLRTRRTLQRTICGSRQRNASRGSQNVSMSGTSLRSPWPSQSCLNLGPRFCPLLGRIFHTLYRRQCIAGFPRNCLRRLNCHGYRSRI
jgi:hypothetical protein